MATEDDRLIPHLSPEPFLLPHHTPRMGSDLTNEKSNHSGHSRCPARSDFSRGHLSGVKMKKGFLATSITEIPAQNGHHSILFIFKEGVKS